MITKTKTVLVATLAFAAVWSYRLAAQQAASPAPRSSGSRFTQPDPIDFEDRAGWTSMFDGSTLKGWDGSSEVWHVENGAITGESSPEKPSGTTYVIWQGGEPRNFELKAEIKLEGGGANSGIQYRSARATQPQGGPVPNPRFAKWNLRGYQADFDYVNRFSGQLMDSGNGRFIMTWRGQTVQSEAGKNARLLASLGDRDALAGYVKIGDWNQYHIIARGHQLMHIVNGHLMSITFDDEPSLRSVKGLIGLQIEGNGGVKVSFRNIWLKTL